jgi:hypothetical protein
MENSACLPRRSQEADELNFDWGGAMLVLLRDAGDTDFASAFGARFDFERGCKLRSSAQGRKSFDWLVDPPRNPRRTVLASRKSFTLFCKG